MFFVCYLYVFTLCCTPYRIKGSSLIYSFDDLLVNQQTKIDVESTKQEILIEYKS